MKMTVVIRNVQMTIVNHLQLKHNFVTKDENCQDINSNMLLLFMS